jgi:hypothetical protein
VFIVFCGFFTAVGAIAVHHPAEGTISNNRDNTILMVLTALTTLVGALVVGRDLDRYLSPSDEDALGTDARCAVLAGVLFGAADGAEATRPGRGRCRPWRRTEPARARKLRRS